MKIILVFAALQAELPKEALDSIRAAEAFDHVRELASDEYEGREAGTTGADRAAEYLAAKLKEWGLKPVGESGTYFQVFWAGGKTRNVLALVEGGHETRRREIVAVGAHYDHLGRRRGGKGDVIYNGADDNASGTAAVLEVAQAFAGLKTRPDRSVLFGWWSAEEKGLLGSSHFVRHPTVELKGVVAYLNLDMVGRNDPDTIDIEGTGSSPQFQPLFDRVNGGNLFRRINYEVTQVKADTDHFPFYRAGIPAVELFSGYHADYHQPSDDVERVSREKLERAARLTALAAWELARAEGRPEYRRTK